MKTYSEIEDFKNNDMTAKSKPGIRAPAHKCTKIGILTRHAEIIERTSYLLYGNGTSKDGLLFKVDKFMDDHEAVLKDISEIKIKVNKAIDDSAKTERMIEDFRSDEEQFEKGKKAILELQAIEEEKKMTQKAKEEKKELTIKKEKRDKIELVLKIVTVIVAVVALYFTINGAFNKVLEGQKAIKADTKVTNEVLIPPGQSIRGLKTIKIDNDTTSTFK